MKRYYVQHWNLHAVNQPCNCAKPCALVVEFTDVQQLARELFVMTDRQLRERLRAIIGEDPPLGMEAAIADRLAQETAREYECTEVDHYFATGCLSCHCGETEREEGGCESWRARALANR